MTGPPQPEPLEVEDGPGQLREPRARPAPARRVPREVVLRQRRRRRRTIIGVTIVLVVVTPTVGIGAAYVRWRLGQINRLDVPGLAGDSAGLMNVLLVGSDSGTGGTGDAGQSAQVPADDSGRSDTIMVLHIDSGRKKAAIVSIPRDLYLPIAGTGRSDRVNTALSIGGAEGLIATVQQGLGIRINHFAEVDYVGFDEMVDAVGGVAVFVPAPARDAFTGLQIGEEGCHELDGTSALAWVRSRHFEYLSQGKWVEDGRADIGRIERQQELIRRLMKKAFSTGASSPFTLSRLFAIGAENVTVDSTMSTRDMTTLARRFSSADPDAVQTFTLPGTDTTVGDATVLMLDKAAAQAPLGLLNGADAPTTSRSEPAPPAATTSGDDRGATVTAVEASIEVLNGTGTRGAAAKVAGELEDAGFTVSGIGDAVGSFAKPVIRYGEGQKGEAEALAAAFETAPELEPDARADIDTLVLVVGTDYDGLRPGVAARASTTVTSTPEAVPVPIEGVPYREC